jgi:hypothetical protein
MFDNEVNKLFASSFCNSRASRERFSDRHTASGLCHYSATSDHVAANFYAVIAEFFPAATDFCSLNIRAFIASSASSYSPMPT